MYFIAIDTHTRSPPPFEARQRGCSRDVVQRERERGESRVSHTTHGLAHGYMPLGPCGLALGLFSGCLNIHLYLTAYGFTGTLPEMGTPAQGVRAH